MKALFETLLGRSKKQPQQPQVPMKAGDLSLVFHATVQSGEGRFSRMVFPTKKELEGIESAPDCWPEKIQPGSMNCRVTAFPDNLYDLAGEGDRIATLDAGKFTPDGRIPREMIENNVVRPYPGGNPDMGIAQVWRCSVTNENTGETFDALHVRRIDGTYPPFHGIIELMADRKLRDAHNLKDGTPLTIRMYSKATL